MQGARETEERRRTWEVRWSESVRSVMKSRAVERNYLKRLPVAGYWQMGLFQRSVNSLPMQCFHCGREVRETTHTQKGYRVDYYLLHTGRTEWSFFKDPKEDAPPLHYLRLRQPVDIISCTNCYANPQIQQRLEEDFNGLNSILDPLT